MRLPDVEAGMQLDQAMFLELYHCLVDEGAISIETAVKRYKDRQSKFGRRPTWFWHSDADFEEIKS